MLPESIHFFTDDFSELGDIIRALSPSKIVVLADENSALYCLPLLENVITKNSLHVIQITSGEESKNLETCIHIWRRMTELGLDRKALMLNLGGGVIGDMGGFCASTYKRGIRFIQIPTTLLSMVDASVGGKLGIDFEGLKNHIGVFNQPEHVVVSPIFLKTLSKRELRSGFAEILKHALISDRDRWESLKSKELDQLDWALEIPHSIAIKWNVVKQDPTEKGLRKILNFGHTLGHAIETHLLFQTERKLLHGEAISIGMITESWLSWKKGFISKDDLTEIITTFKRIYSTPVISHSEIAEIINITLQDKKNESSKVLFSLLNSIGEANFDIPVTPHEMGEALAFYIDEVVV